MGNHLGRRAVKLPSHKASDEERREIQHDEHTDQGSTSDLGAVGQEVPLSASQDEERPEIQHDEHTDQGSTSDLGAEGQEVPLSASHDEERREIQHDEHTDQGSTSDLGSVGQEVPLSASQDEERREIQHDEHTDQGSTVGQEVPLSASQDEERREIQHDEHTDQGSTSDVGAVGQEVPLSASQGEERHDIQKHGKLPVQEATNILVFPRRKMLLGTSQVTKPIDRFYQVGSPIMSGGFGTVFSGERKSDNFPVAVKYVPKDRVERMKFVNGALIPMEIYLMQKVSTGFQGVINLLDWYEQDDSFAMVMERPEQVQDLFDYITERRALREDVAAKFFSQVVSAVTHCHNCGVLHNDIKDENILVDLATNQTKLIDFGSATLLHDQAYTELQGTYEYLPPEWFCFHRFHGRSAAVWTLGILLYDMLCGNVPFANQEEIVKGKIKYPIGISKGCQDMIRWCLSKKPADRPTLEQIQSHPWVSQNKLDTIKEENEPEQDITNQRNENL